MYLAATPMRLLFVGDIFGRPGRDAVHRFLGPLRRELNVDMVIANGENATHGTGMSDSAYRELAASGIDVFTGGNHSLSRPDTLALLEAHDDVLCPGNASSMLERHGWTVLSVRETSVAVLNAMGQYCLTAGNNPFEYVERMLDIPEIRACKIRCIDFHAESTAEKAAMLHLLDGRVSAILGTHTHVPTADARISDRGTAFVTDVGMTGVVDSIIGLDPSRMVQRYRTGIAAPPKVADGTATLMAALVEIDETTGQALHISMLQRST